MNRAGGAPSTSGCLFCCLNATAASRTAFAFGRMCTVICPSRTLFGVSGLVKKELSRKSMRPMWLGRLRMLWNRKMSNRCVNGQIKGIGSSDAS